MAGYRLRQSGEEVQGILDNAAMRAQLTAETERAQTVEQQLQTNIDSEATARQQAVANEAEARASAVAGEASARQQADTTLQQHIDAEQSRAEDAEGSLQTAINSEAQTRQQADGVLDGKIAAEAQARAQADQTLDGKIGANTQAIATEKTRAEGAEGALQTTIGEEAQSRQQADGVLDGKIAAEKTRAEGAEGALQTAIGNEAQARQQADGVLDGKIAAEKTRAEGAEGSLQTAIDNEAKARQQTEGALDVSELNATENPHTLAKYVNLSAAIAAIPTDYQKGGMSIKFVQSSSDNKYAQYRYMGTATTGNPNPFLDTANWQGVDDEPTAGSQNLVTSGGVSAAIYSKTGNTATLQLTWTTGKRVDTGTANPDKILNASNEYAISNYIDITNFANAIYEFSGLHGLTNVHSPSINFYDENKNHIGYLYEDGNYSLEKSNIPSGAKYIFICQCTVSEYPTSSVSVTEIIPPTIILPTEQVMEGNKTQEEINAEVNADIDEIKNKIESFEGKIVEPELSWANSKRVDSAYSSASKIIGASDVFYVSNYIEIPNSFDIARAEGVQAYASIHSYPINFYDSNKVWIGCSDDVKGAYDFTEIIPTNAKYVVLCQYITSSYPIANVKIVFETEATFVTPDGVEDIVSEHLEPVEGEIAVLSESSTKVMITQDDIDSTVSNPNFVVENGTIKSNSTIGTDGSGFMLFKPDITAIEFTIGDLWDGSRFELCLGCGYYNEARVNAAAVLVAPNDYFIVSSVGANNDDQGTMFAQDARENPIPIVSVGDRCMVEIVLDKYILGWVWDGTHNKWNYWFMLNPTDPSALCNPVHTRVRYGWNERIGIGLSVVYTSASAGLEMMKDVNILSRKGTNLEIYHNKVRMGRKFSNRRWLAIGDSITAYDGLNGWGYVGYVSRRNMLNTINCGNSGWTMCNIWQKHAGFAPYEEIKVDWEDAVAELGINDVVTIFAGTNDFHSVGRTDIDTVEPYRYPITLGATDPTDANAKNPRTTLGALRLLIEKLQDTNPSAKIIVFAPFLRTDTDYPVNTEGMTMREFSDAICDVAKEYGLEHYNLCDYAGINTISIESLTNDGLHPNQKGGERLGEIMARWIY